MVLNGISLMANDDVEYFFHMCNFPPLYLLWRSAYSCLIPNFLNHSFKMVGFWVFLCLLGTSAFLNMWLVNIEVVLKEALWQLCGKEALGGRGGWGEMMVVGTKVIDAEEVRSGQIKSFASTATWTWWWVGCGTWKTRGATDGSPEGRAEKVHGL